MKHLLFGLASWLSMAYAMWALLTGRMEQAIVAMLLAPFLMALSYPPKITNETLSEDEE